ncbi:MAG: hydroxymethylbilane synthase [Chloroflexota bacterium]|nr:hydroxymethylbilane synthase [Chloroflexota bacterium]
MRPTPAPVSAEKRLLTIGTRSSKLALVQAELVRAALLNVRPDLDVRLEHITTKGDVVQDRPLSEIGGNGLFVTQIEEALRAGTVDVAVHSAKDLASTLPPDMSLGAFLPRADARDVLVSRDGATLSELPPGARVGTSSPRRTCQVRAMRPDLTVLDIRGNVDTRLRKLRDGHYDAIVLAAAGLARLGMLDCVTEWFPTDVMIPAVAQGALAVEVRAGDAFTRELASKINDPLTATVVRAERAFLARIGGGCSLPIGAYATVAGGEIRIVGMIGSVEGRVLRGVQVGAESEPEQAGARLAEQLLDRGGRKLIAAEEARSRG